MILCLLKGATGLPEAVYLSIPSLPSILSTFLLFFGFEANWSIKQNVEYILVNLEATVDVD